MIQEKKQRIIIVLGMHRSGTSAVTRGLTALGIDLGSQLLLPVPDNNETGFWEDTDLYTFDNELLAFLGHDWHTLTPIQQPELQRPDLVAFKLRAIELLHKKLKGLSVFGMKDPRLTILLPFWQDVFEHIGLEASYVVVVRHPISVARSLHKRDGFDPEKSGYLWLEHIVSCILNTADRPRIVVDYDRLMEQPEKQLRRIAEALKLPFDENSAAIKEYTQEFLRDDLRHTRFTLKDILLDPSIPPETSAAYELLSQLARDDLDTEASEVELFFRSLEQQLTALRPALHYMTRQDKRISRLCKELETKEHESTVQGKIKEERDSQIDVLGQLVAERDNQVAALSQALAAKDKVLHNLTEQLSALNAADFTGKIATLNEMLIAKERTLEECNRQIATLTKDCALKNSQNAGLTQALAEKNEKINENGQIITGLRVRNAALTQQIIEKDQKLTGYEIRVSGLITEIRIRDEKIAALNGLIEEKEKSIARQEQVLATQITQISSLNQTLSQQSEQIATLLTTVEAQDGLLEDRDARIHGLNQESEEQRHRITELDRTVNQLNAQVSQLHSEINSRDTKIAALGRTLTEKEKCITEKEQGLTVCRGQIEQTKREFVEIQTLLNSVLNSSSWKLTEPLRGLRRNLITRPIQHIQNRILLLKTFLKRIFCPALMVRQNVKDAVFTNLPTLFSHTQAYSNWQKTQHKAVKINGFNAKWYLKQNPDVKSIGMCPYEHYVKYGQAEGRLPAPLKVKNTYLRKIKQILKAIKQKGGFRNTAMRSLQVLRDEGTSGLKYRLLKYCSRAASQTPPTASDMILIDTIVPTSKTEGRIAIHLHMYYHDLADEFVHYLKNMPFPYDLYVSVSTKEGLQVCHTKFKSLVKLNKLLIEQVPNRGRDIAPMFCTFGKYLKNYDYIAHLHSKKSLYNKGATEGWRQYLCEGLLGGEKQIRKILTLMQGDKPHGMVYPQNYRLLPYQANTWLANRGMGEAWCSRLGISPVPSGYFNFPAGSMFWARGDALSPLFETGIQLNDFAEESGQTDGTFAHCLERLLTLSVGKQGYSVGIIKDTNYPTWAPWRFEQFSLRPIEHLVAQMQAPNIKVIAFDIFDTLLCRPLLNPDAIKRIVAKKIGEKSGELYLQYRHLAEAQAREKAGRDIGMNRIFKQLRILTALPEKTVQMIRKTEEETEVASLSPRPDGIEIFRRAVSTGKPVILISDMFLPRTVIEKCLYANGIRGWNDLFLSSDIGLRKDSGQLYDYVLNLFNISPAELIMVGDNERSDLQIPWDKGIIALHIIKPVEFARSIPRFRPLIEANESSGNPHRELTLGPVINKNFSRINYSEFDPHCLVQTDPFHLGYSHLGPLLTAMSQWLIDIAGKDNIKRLYFLSREGKLMKQVYDLWTEGLNQVPRAVYLVVSRRCLSVPQIKNASDILEIAGSNDYFQNTASNFIFERFGLTLSDRRWREIEERTGWFAGSLLLIHGGQTSHLDLFLKNITQDILDNAANETGALLHYLNAMKLNDAGGQAVVDIGYGASIQNYLNHLCRTPVHGYYLATDERSALVKKKHNVIIRGCYLENVHRNRTAPLMYLKSFELEKFMSSDDAQVVRYNLDQAGSLSAVYRTLSKEESDSSSVRKILQAGVMQYAHDALEIRNRMWSGFKPSCTAARQIYDAFLLNQSPAETGFFNNIFLDDHYCGRTVV